MKTLVTVTIEAPTPHELKDARYHINKAIDSVRIHINNGSEINRASTNADDPKELKSLFGDLQWWSTGGGKPPQDPNTEKKKHGWLAEIKEGLRSLYEDEPEFGKE